MQYGDTAVIPGVGAERFAAFAFAAYLQSGAETRVNLQHESDLVVASTRPGDRGDLYLLDGPHELRMVARCRPATLTIRRSGADRRPARHRP